MQQRNRHFEPELLVIPVGSSVEFPNIDGQNLALSTFPSHLYHVVQQQLLQHCAESESGCEVPIGGEVYVVSRLQRTQMRLGPHWFWYSNLEVRSSSYFTYETGSDNRPEVQFHAIQAFVG